MKKHSIALMIIISMLVLFSSFIVSAADNQQTQLTLEDAQKRALANNLEYIQQDDKINDSLDDYYNTEESNDKSYSAAAKGFYEYFMKPINLETSLQGAINSVKIARLKKDSIKRTSDLNVRKAFVNIKKAQYAMEEAKANTLIKSKEYEAAKIKYDLGLIKKASLKQTEDTYDSAIAAETESLSSLQQNMQTLNRYLGRPLTDYNLQLVMDMSVADISSIDLDKIREDYISNKEELYSLALKAELAKKKYDTAKERYDEFVVRLSVQNSRDDMEEAFDVATREYENARKAFEDATIDLDMTLSTSFEALKTASDSITDLQESIALTKEDTEIAKVQYDMGLISKNNLDKAVLDMEALNNKLQTTIADFNLQYSNLMMYSK